MNTPGHTEIRITVPRGALLSANQRLHWAAKAKRTTWCRQLAGLAWVAAGSPRHERVAITCTVTYANRSRRRDVHNLYPTAKALIDGMVAGWPEHAGRGLLPDDNDRHLIGPDMRASDETTGTTETYFRFDIEDI